MRMWEDADRVVEKVDSQLVVVVHSAQIGRDNAGRWMGWVAGCTGRAGGSGGGGGWGWEGRGGEGE